MNAKTLNLSRSTDTHVILKGRKVSIPLFDFVCLIVDDALPALRTEPDFPRTIRELFHPKIWGQLSVAERRKAGLCLSWLVDQGHVRLVKQQAKRGNSLTYKLN